MTEKAPRFIDVAGLPASGKSSTARQLVNSLNEQGYNCQLIPESAESAPIPEEKRDWSFFVWTLNNTLNQIIVEASDSNTDIVVIDRGLVDKLVWLNWHQKNNTLNEQEARVIRDYITQGPWFEWMGMAIFLMVSPEVSIQRKGEGRIVNEQTLQILEDIYRSTIKKLREYNTLSVSVVETDNLNLRSQQDMMLNQILNTL